MGPIAVTPDADGKVTLCLCKHTGNAPYCDGSHAGLPAD
jgi:CDGSH-type Zn-finger protein